LGKVGTMKRLGMERIGLIVLAVVAAAGWGRSMEAEDAEEETAEATRPERRGTRGGGPRTTVDSLGRLATSARSARLFSSLEEIAAAGRPGEVNESLVKAYRQTMADPDYVRRVRDFGLLLELMRPEDAERMHHEFVMLHQEGKGFDFEYGAFATRWGEIDPEGALGFFTSQNPVRIPPHDLEKIAKGWGETDPQAALRWMDANPEMADARDGRPSVVKGWFRQDPEGATAYLMSGAMPGAQVDEAVRYGLVERLYSHGFEDAGRWLASLPDTELGNNAAAWAWRSSQDRLSQLSPENAARLWSSVGHREWMDFPQFLRFSSMVSRGDANPNGVAGFFDALAGEWAVDDAAAQFSRWRQKHPNEVDALLSSAPDSEFLRAVAD